MSSYLTEAEELTRRYELDEHQSQRHHHRVPPTHPKPRRRARVAAGLRRVADRLEQ